MSRKNINRSNKILAHWDDLLDDIHAIATEYESEGWETLVLHPGDVTTVVGESAKFQITVPESELNTLKNMIDGGKKFDEFELHHAPIDDLLLFIIGVKSSKNEQVILFLTYYNPDSDEEFVAAIRKQESIFTEITNLDRSSQYSFRHDNSSLFLP